jgi:hypothetical protein
MFFWKTSVLLDGLREYLPKTAVLLASLPEFTKRRFTPKIEGSVPASRTSLSISRCSKNPPMFSASPPTNFGWNH